MDIGFINARTLHRHVIRPRDSRTPPSPRRRRRGAPGDEDRAGMKIETYRRIILPLVRIRFAPRCVCRAMQELPRRLQGIRQFPRQFPPTFRTRPCDRGFAACSTVRASDRGDATGAFGLGGNGCRALERVDGKAANSDPRGPASTRDEPCHGHPRPRTRRRRIAPGVPDVPAALPGRIAAGASGIPTAVPAAGGAAAVGAGVHRLQGRPCDLDDISNNFSILDQYL